MSALAAVLAVAAVGRTAAANPPPTFCEVSAGECHPMVGKTLAHFLKMLRQVVRAVPRIPGYRCHSEGRHIDEVGYGRNARRAAPERMFEEIWCFQRGTDPRNRYPDVSISVSLSMLPAALAEGGAPGKERDLLVFTGPQGASFVFGKIREWRDPKGVVHRGYAPSEPSTSPIGRIVYSAEEVVSNGPYLVSAIVGINTASPAARDAFAAGFDRAAVAALMAREAQRRKADRDAGPIVGVLREVNAAVAGGGRVDHT